MATSVMAAGIVASSPPSFDLLREGQSPAGRFQPGDYESDGEAIASAHPYFFVNGVFASGSTRLTEGDEVHAWLVVADSSGAKRTFASAPTRVAEAISASVLPSFQELVEMHTPQERLAVGAYQSAAGQISSVDPVFYVNGLVAQGGSDLADGDLVRAAVVVTDSAGNSRTFETPDATVLGMAEWIFGNGESGALLDFTSNTSS